MNASNAIHRATTALATIRTHWQASEEPPRPTQLHRHTPPRSRPPAPQAPLRADIINTLTFWAKALADEHPHTLQHHRIDDDGKLHTTTRHIDLADPHATSNYLQEHLDILDRWGYLKQFTREVIELAAALHELVTQPNQDRPPIGDCHLTADGKTPGPDTADAPDCDGTVRAIPTRDPKTGAVTYEEARCTRCKSLAVIGWWRTQWGAGAELVTTAQLADALAAQGIRVKPATIRGWLFTGRILSSGTNTNGDRLYDVAAVVMALNAHEAKKLAGGSVAHSRTSMSETQPEQVSR